jgi:hypothetical protein
VGRHARHNFFERDDPPRFWVEWKGLGLYRGRVTYCYHCDFTFCGDDRATLLRRLAKVADRVAREGCIIPGCFRNGGHV